MSQVAAGEMQTAPEKPGVSWQEIVRHPAFLLGCAALAGIVLAFWPLIRFLPELWMSEDGYYSHGWLVPAISGYIVYRWWPKLKDTPVKTGWLALLFLVPLLFVLQAAYKMDMRQIMSLSLVAALLLGIWFVGGFRWLLKLALPTLYLGFMLPLTTWAIDNYTNQLQVWSTQVAYKMLEMMNMSPYREDATVIHLNNFTLDVGVPCSGLKLVIAVTAFTTFFMMIGNLKWVGNLIMVAMIIPICLFINGLRIALIGVVGDMYGSDAGHQFHDYSGYITLIICFLIIFKIARILGWKD